MNLFFLVKWEGNGIFGSAHHFCPLYLSRPGATMIVQIHFFTHRQKSCHLHHHGGRNTFQAVTQQPTGIWPVAMYSQKAYGAPDMTIPFSGSSRYLVLGERYFCDSACHNPRIPSHYLSDHSNSPCFDKVYFQFLQEPIIIYLPILFQMREP